MTSPDAVRSTTRRLHDDSLAVLVDLAADLTAHLGSADRSQRLVEMVKRIVPCDSAVLLRLDGDVLIPVAASGLVPEVMSLRFVVAEHPRFAQILRRKELVRFPDSDLPDPFDGLLASGQPLTHVHACMGIPLQISGETIGVLALDALAADAFDTVSEHVVEGVASLAAAGMRTGQLIDALAKQATTSEQIVRQLARDSDHHTGEVIAASAAMRAVCQEAELASHSDLAVLITGETGTGKEVVARAIHAGSARAARPLIYVNCAALPESIAESELFGHVRGSFTGAIDNRAGKFEIADQGTLFLDEIGELPLSIQAKLLRALQTGEIQRVGADHVIRVDVRIIAATNRDLPGEVAAGRFRADLFHRISVYPIEVPPLRERREDIALLAGVFLDEARKRLALGPVRLTTDARAALVAHDWPGNVRELEHTILRAALRAAKGRRREVVVVDAEALDLAPRAAPPTPAPPVDDHGTLDQAIDELKRHRISIAVERCHGNWAQAARRLGVDRGNLHRMAKRLGMRT